MKKITFLMMAALMFITASCTIKKVTKDNGPKITKEYNLKEFNQLSLENSAKVVFVQDSVYSIKAVASQKTLDQMEISVEDCKLTISESKHQGQKIFNIGNNSDDYVITIHAPKLKTVTVAGSGIFESEKVTADDFTLSLAGSGIAKIENFEGNSIKVGVAGSGVVNITENNVANSEIGIAGSGIIDATMKDCGYVKAGITGSGVITLSGNADQVESSSKGGVINQGNLKTKR